MNNRQAGRRRGRGGQRSQGGNPNQQGNGNRIDNRARGNAAQLLEKYKNLARDAQMQGDRVNTEYYLQFADHYFRVLSESRSRFEEQNQQRRPRDEFDGDEDDFDLEADGGRDEAPQQQPQQREAREYRDNRERGDRGDRDRGDRREGRNGRANGNGNGNGYANGNGYHVEVTGEVEAAEPANDAAPEAPVEQPRRRGRPPRTPRVEAEGEVRGIDVAVLPPSIGVEAAAEGDAKPRRRRKKADEVEAPAA